MNTRRVLLVLGKEVREALRDRRTLFVTLVLPMLLYPGLMVGLGTVTARQVGKLREATQRVAFAGPVPEALRARLLAPERGLAVAEPQDAEKDLKAGTLHLLVRAALDFPEALRDGRTARLELVHDSANEPSAEARRKALESVEAFRREVLARRLLEREIPPAYIQPVEVAATTTTDVASPAKRGAHAFGRILSMMLVLMVITGAFTPAVDAVAGEKERGTMETLLVCPATRLEVVLGKFLSVFAVSLATALGNLVSMALTFGQLAGTLGMRQRLDFSIDLGTAAVIFAILLPLAALFSSLALALSTLARSTKEAQTYLTPILLVAMPLAMVSVIPNIELDAAKAAAPVAGAVLLFRDLLLAQGEPEMLGRVLPLVPVVLGSTILAAALSLRWAVWMFGREEVLFRDPGVPFAWKDLRAPRRAGTVPGPGGAVFLPAAALAATFLLGQVLLKPGAGGGAIPIWAVAFQQGVLLLAVMAGVGVAGLDPKSTLGLRLPGAAFAGAAALVGIGAPLATPWLMKMLDLVPRGDQGTAALLEALVRRLDPVSLVLLLGLLPAVAEELLFRGWCLRGFRSQMSGLAAVVLSSVLFGAFHLEPERIAFTTALGLGLGFLALRSGSVCPGLLAHALHNGITVAFARSTLDGDTTTFAARTLEGADPALGGVGIGLVAAGIALAAVVRRRDSLPGAERAG